MKRVRAWHRVPLAVWIVLGVVVIHALLFWAVSGQRFLPKTRYVPPAQGSNFAAGQQRSIDPQTGQATTERQFQVSTLLATPPKTLPRPQVSPGATP